MTEELITLREFCESYRKGEFDASDRDTQIKAGWYDWFCADDKLADELKKIWEVLKGIENDFLLDNYRVWFKNHRPVYGVSHNDVRFEPLNILERDTHYFLITVESPKEKHKYTVYTMRNNLEAEAAFDDVADIHKWLNDWKDPAKSTKDKENNNG